MNKKLSQWNKIQFTIDEELWLPKEGSDSALEALKVKRQKPFIAIYLMAEGEQKIPAFPIGWSKQTSLTNFLHMNTKSQNGKRKSTKESGKKRNR